MKTERLVRSALYLPASNDRAVEKARTLAADAIILDLEDAVAPDSKVAARRAAVDAVAAGGFRAPTVAIRVNHLGTAWGAQDFVAASASAADVIVVPKVDSAEQAAAAVASAGGKDVWAMIESPRALIALTEIVAVPGLSALVAGFADLAKELRATVDAQRLSLLYAMSAIVVAARSRGLIALDGMHPDVPDLEGLDFTSRQGAMFGFDGRTIIHPTHIEIANRAYAPSEEAVANARGLVAAHADSMAEGRGVTTYKGRLVEVLHVEEAKRLVALADLVAARADTSTD